MFREISRSRSTGRWCIPRRQWVGDLNNLEIEVRCNRTVQQLAVSWAERLSYLLLPRSWILTQLWSSSTGCCNGLPTAKSQNITTSYQYVTDGIGYWSIDFNLQILQLRMLSTRQLKQDLHLARRMYSGSLASAEIHYPWMTVAVNHLSNRKMDSFGTGTPMFTPALPTSHLQRKIDGKLLSCFTLDSTHFVC